MQVDDVTFQHCFPSIHMNNRNLYVVYEYGQEAYSRRAEILTMPEANYSTADEIKSALATTLNNGNRWNGSNRQFAVTLTDEILTVAINHADTAPDISGHWVIYDGSTTPATQLSDVMVTQASSTHYNFVESGANYTLDITA